MPGGLGLTNHQLIGSLNTDGGRNEGEGGWRVNTFLSNGSPFYKNGAVDFNAYLDQDSIYEDTSHKGVDLIYILLGANNDVFASIEENNKIKLTETGYEGPI